MGSRIKSLFFGRSPTSTSTSTNKSNSSNNNSLRSSRPYHSIAASDPPVKGSYPVAGNGPNVLQQLQQQRYPQSTLASLTAPSPNVPLRRDDTALRPHTAPHDGTAARGGHTRSKSSRSTNGRSMSGFSMKSPPSFFGSASTSHPDLKSSSMPRISSPASREIKTYIPTKCDTPHSRNTSLHTPTPPFAQHQHSRTTSVAARKSHVDILDAHSTITRSRAGSLHQTRVAPARNYGEDVADRNIDAFGERAYRDLKLDLSSPEYSYLKSVYTPKKSTGREGAGSPLGHVLGREGTSGDDIQQRRSRTLSIPRSGPRPAPTFPPRTDSASAASLPYNRGRAMSPLSPGAASISEDPHARNHQNPQFVNSSRALSTSPLPEHGRARPTTATTTASSTSTTKSGRLVPLSNAVPSNPRSRHESGATVKEATSPNNKRRSLSAASLSPAGPPASGRRRSSRGSVSYSAFPQTSDSGQTSSRPNTSSTNKRAAMIVEGASQPPSRDGVVDLSNSVDTDVITGHLPAVLHEHVTPTRHEIRQEVLTREIHNHDVYHRILPVTQTEILPTQHYVRSQDGKTLVEIPESEVSRHTVTGKSDQGWHLSKPGPSMISNGCETASRASTDSARDGPVIGLARGEPGSRPRGNSTAHSIKSTKREPILSSKKETTSKDGIAKTEYVWRHPPVFETINGQTQPVYVAAGLGDSSNHPSSGAGAQHYSEEDELGAEFGAARSTSDNKGEEGLLFRDSGYGFGGMLPGLAEMNPASTSTSTSTSTASGSLIPSSSSNRARGGVLGLGDEPVPVPVGKTKPKPKLPSTAEEGAATKAVRGKASASGATNVNSTATASGALEDGVRDMRIE